MIGRSQSPRTGCSHSTTAAMGWTIASASLDQTRCSSARYVTLSKQQQHSPTRLPVTTDMTCSRYL